MQMKTQARGQAARISKEFAQLLGMSARALQDGEQKRREPTGAARTLPSIERATSGALRAPEVAPQRQRWSFSRSVRQQWIA
jgi:putative transcriptional regulator